MENEYFKNKHSGGEKDEALGFRLGLHEEPASCD